MTRKIQDRFRYLEHKIEEGRYQRKAATALGVAEEDSLILTWGTVLLEEAAFVIALKGGQI